MSDHSAADHHAMAVQLTRRVLAELEIGPPDLATATGVGPTRAKSWADEHGTATISLHRLLAAREANPAVFATFLRQLAALDSPRPARPSEYVPRVDCVIREWVGAICEALVAGRLDDEEHAKLARDLYEVIAKAGQALRDLNRRTLT